jgi:hypothetical protein
VPAEGMYAVQVFGINYDVFGTVQFMFEKMTKLHGRTAVEFPRQIQLKIEAGLVHRNFEILCHFSSPAVCGKLRFQAIRPPRAIPALTLGVCHSKTLGVPLRFLDISNQLDSIASIFLRSFGFPHPPDLAGLIVRPGLCFHCHWYAPPGSSTNLFLKLKNWFSEPSI